MTIDRRKAILTLMGTWTAMATGAQTNPDSGSIAYATPLMNPPQGIAFYLDSFTGFNFTYKGKTIKITPEEIWEALGGKP